MTQTEEPRGMTPGFAFGVLVRELPFRVQFAGTFTRLPHILAIDALWETSLLVFRYHAVPAA